MVITIILITKSSNLFRELKSALRSCAARDFWNKKPNKNGKFIKLREFRNFQKILDWKLVPYRLFLNCHQKMKLFLFKSPKNSKLWLKVIINSAIANYSSKLIVLLRNFVIPQFFAKINFRAIRGQKLRKNINSNENSQLKVKCKIVNFLNWLNCLNGA